MNGADRGKLVRAKIRGYEREPQDYFANTADLSDKDKAAKVRSRNGAVTGMLNKIFGDDENRRLVLAYLFGDSQPIRPISSKALSEAQWMALHRWIDWWKNPETGEWLTQADLQKEALDLLNAVLDEHGKLRLRLRRAFERDPLDFVDNLVTLGGEIVEITDAPPDLPQKRGEYVPVDSDPLDPGDADVEW